jgi:hypothetical protein
VANVFFDQGLVDLIEDLRQVIFAGDGGGKFQNLEVEFTIVRLLLLGTPLSILLNFTSFSLRAGICP